MVTGMRSLSGVAGVAMAGTCSEGGTGNIGAKPYSIKVSSRAVQEMLGHASIASTQVYTHLDFQHLAKVYDAAHPRSRRKKGKI